MAKTLGSSVEKIIGKNIFDILPREISEERLKIVRKALEDEEIQVTEDEQGGRHFDSIYVPLVHPNGEKTLQIISRDISVQKKAEEELIKNIKALEKYKDVTVDRELRMVELKKEINELYKKYGQKPKCIIN